MVSGLSRSICIKTYHSSEFSAFIYSPLCLFSLLRAPFGQSSNVHFEAVAVAPQFMNILHRFRTIFASQFDYVFIKIKRMQENRIDKVSDVDIFP